jgi:hypothetical protein
VHHFSEVIKSSYVTSIYTQKNQKPGRKRSHSGKRAIAFKKLNGKGRRGDKGRERRSDRSFICPNKRSHFLTLNPNQQAIALSSSSKIPLCQRYLNSNKKRKQRGRDIAFLLYR